MYISSLLSFYALHFAETSSAIIIPFPRVVTCENIKPYFVYVYGFSGQISEMMSKNELNNTLTV